ncbi:MAG: YciI family protein [Actinomycetota bacterium]|nr:YciI family protein [Actinomycetota bacterium]
MPRYAALIYGPEETDENTPPEVWAAIMAEYTDFGATAGAAGVIAGGEALQDTKTATTVHVKGGAKGGEVITSDGPFAETKEVLGGFYLLDCADLDEALHWAAQIPGAWHGRVEVRPVIDFSQQQ